MTAKTWLQKAQKDLQMAGIGTARLDALVLLEDETGIDRALLLANSHNLADESIKRLGTKIKRRAKHEPLAYIRQKTEFFGRDFFVDDRVLEPRPESETMIELLLESLCGLNNSKQLVFGASAGYKPRTASKNQLLKNLNIKKAPLIIDVGTGSGALAITAKLELGEVEVVATDIDPQCLQVAKINAKKHDAKIDFLQGNLLDPIKNLKNDNCKLQIVLANLPYVPEDWHINQAAGHEPKKAIFGGKDGLDLYRRLFKQIGKLKTKPLYVLTESLPPQHEALQKIANQSGYTLVKSSDFIQLFTGSAKLQA